MSARRDGERGSTTLWTLVLAMSLLALGGVSLDLWSALGAHRDLAGIADAAAAAGASGIDTELFRTTGEVALDDMLAPSLAVGLIVAQPNGGDLLGAPVIDVAPDGRSITVTLSRSVDLTLMRMFVPNGTVTVSATARSDASLRQ